MWTTRRHDDGGQRFETSPIDDRPIALIGTRACDLAALALQDRHFRLPEDSRRLLQTTGLAFPSNNTFHSLLAGAIEIHVAVGEAIRLLQNYRLPDEPQRAVTPSAGIGFGPTEAPRGLLWHRDEVDQEGIVRSARIVPPTSQNQPRIEADLNLSLQTFSLQQAEDALQLRADQKTTKNLRQIIIHTLLIGLYCCRPERGRSLYRSTVGAVFE